MRGSNERMGDPAELQRPGVRIRQFADDRRRTEHGKGAGFPAIGSDWLLVGATRHVARHVHARHFHTLYRVRSRRQRRRHSSIGRRYADGTNNDPEQGGNEEQPVQRLQKPHDEYTGTPKASCEVGFTQMCTRDPSSENVHVGISRQARGLER